jgi:hypothetical protein
MTSESTQTWGTISEEFANSWESSLRTPSGLSTRKGDPRMVFDFLMQTPKEIMQMKNSTPQPAIVGVNNPGTDKESCIYKLDDGTLSRLELPL